LWALQSPHTLNNRRGIICLVQNKFKKIQNITQGGRCIINKKSQLIGSWLNHY
jgi:hypothetical protein